MTPKIALSMHSFTKNYENSQRHMEIGILANYSMDLAEKVENS